MEPQKFKNFLKHSNDDESKFQTKKWCAINDQNNGQYGKRDQNDSTIKFSTKSAKPFLLDYADAYILVTGGENGTKVAFKNCHPFIRAITHLNDEHVAIAENLDLIRNMYNLIEYSDNYADSTASFYHYKRQEQNLNAAGAIEDLDPDDSFYFKYKANLFGDLEEVAAGENPNLNATHRLWKNVGLKCKF